SGGLSRFLTFAQINTDSGTNVKGAAIQGREFLPSHNVRNQQEDDFIGMPLFIVLREEILQNRNLAEDRRAGMIVGDLIFQNAAQQVHLSIFEPDLMVDATAADDGLADAANGGCASLVGDIERQLKLISLSGWTCGVMSMLTPTSRY